MERLLFASVLGLLTTIGAACSKADPAASGDARHGENLSDASRLASGNHTGQAPAAAPGKAETPDKVVRQFLEAARSGDQQRLSLLMTDAAREETSKHNINFELASYQNATFEVGEFQYLTPEKNTAQVLCKWTDHDGDASFTHDVVWALRKEEPGWRVVGMITRPFPDQPEVVFNYENVKELMERKAMIEQEVKRRAEIEEKEARRAARRGSSEK